MTHAKMAANHLRKDVAVAEWYVVHTRPRQEDRAIRNLLLRGIELLARWEKAPRKLGGVEPLFPGYVLGGSILRNMLRNVRFTRGVHSVVSLGEASASSR
jgi:transcriptional antiterminator RfaH